MGKKTPRRDPRRDPRRRAIRAPRATRARRMEREDYDWLNPWKFDADVRSNVALVASNLYVHRSVYADAAHSFYTFLEQRI